MSSVVGGEENDGVFGELEFVEFVDDTPDVGIEVLHHRCVSGVVLARAGGGLVTMEDFFGTAIAVEFLFFVFFDEFLGSLNRGAICRCIRFGIRRIGRLRRWWFPSQEGEESRAGGFTG